MEMNRYLLAALYVMAGCAVAVPLKAQQNGEVLRGERCRLVITHTVKVISICLDEEENVSHFCGVLPKDYYFPETGISGNRYFFCSAGTMNPGSLCRTALMIRAPESK